MSHASVVVPVGILIAGDFPSHRGPVTADLARNFSRGKPGIEAAHDLNALITTEPMSSAARPRPISRIC